MNATASPLLNRAIEVALHSDALTLDDMCAVTAIAAPGGQEAQRGRWMAERLREYGLSPFIDEVGNVVATAPASSPAAPHLVVASHLDTVFPADTPLEIMRDGSRLTGPGISDNGRGLAAMLAVARALAAVEWPLVRPLTLLASVGEEGAGDLRGVKHFMATRATQTAAFVALDGAGLGRIITGGIGSRRLRVTFTGRGGHSWSDFGAPHAIHDAARAIASLAALELRPRTTLSVGRVAGGSSINAIPAEAWFEVDMRAERTEDLAELEGRARATLQADTDIRIDVFGDRPAGRTDPGHALVLEAIAATRAVGSTAEMASSSTDANVPMALGVPAIAIGAGGRAGGAHTTAEWYDNADGPGGIERALRLVFGLVGQSPALTSA